MYRSLVKCTPIYFIIFDGIVFLMSVMFIIVYRNATEFYVVISFQSLFITIYPPCSIPSSSLILGLQTFFMLLSPFLSHNFSSPSPSSSNFALNSCKFLYILMKSNLAIWSLTCSKIFTTKSTSQDVLLNKVSSYSCSSSLNTLFIPIYYMKIIQGWKSYLYH